MSNHIEFYKKAEYYDIAFDFRDIPKECNFLETLAAKFLKKKPAGFMELCGGPAYHTIEFARRGLKATALDLSPEMVQYGKKKAQSNGTAINYVNGDMVSFQLPDKYDLAALLMDSVSYLLDNESVYRHFRSVANCLNPGGIYIIEMSHPRGPFKIGEPAVLEWEMERDYIKVKTKWSDDSDIFDPITQITNTTVRIEYTDGIKKGVINDKAPQRCFTTNEFKALVDASGCFKIVDMYGSMDSTIPFNNDKEAWRMIPVLQKV